MIHRAGFRCEFVSSVLRASSASVSSAAQLWHHWTHWYRAGGLPAPHCRGCSLSVLLLSTASRVHPGWAKRSENHEDFIIRSWMWLLINSPSSLRSRVGSLLCGSRRTSRRRNVCFFRGMPGRLSCVHCTNVTVFNLMLRLPHNVSVEKLMRCENT